MAIGSELYYYHHSSEYSKYTIEIELMNGSKDTIVVSQPKDIHFQINCHSSKREFQDCDLQYVSGDLFMGIGGYWNTQISGVINFKILKQE